VVEALGGDLVQGHWGHVLKEDIQTLWPLPSPLSLLPSHHELSGFTMCFHHCTALPQVQKHWG
jgi:hypothetical protein